MVHQFKKFQHGARKQQQRPKQNQKQNKKANIIGSIIALRKLILKNKSTLVKLNKAESVSNEMTLSSNNLSETESIRKQLSSHLRVNSFKSYNKEKHIFHVVKGCFQQFQQFPISY